jgi:hypothetical protein
MPTLIVGGLSLYIAAVYGFGGARALLALHSGFPDYASGTIAAAVINAFALDPHHMTTIGAALGATKIAIAGFFLLALTERSSSDADEPPDHETLGLALHGGIAVTLLLLVPSWTGGDFDAIRTHGANLLLLFVMVGVGRYERGQAAREATRLGYLEDSDDFLASADLPLPTGKAPLA